MLPISCLCLQHIQQSKYQPSLHQFSSCSTTHTKFCTSKQDLQILLVNVLEMLVNINLCIVATVTLYVRSAGGNQNAVTFTSISAAFVTFLGIVIYHLAQQIRAAPQWWRRLHPSRDYNADRLAVADSEPQDRALTRPSTAQFATVVYININDIVRAQLAESHV